MHVVIIVHVNNDNNYNDGNMTRASVWFEFFGELS